MAEGVRRLALNQATIPAWGLDMAIEACARAGLGGIGVWRDKLQQLGLTEAKRALRAAGLVVPSLCKSARLSEPEGPARRRLLEENRKALDEAAEIGASCLVMVVGGVASGSRDIVGARARVKEGLEELLPYAKACGVLLGLEPLHPMYAADRSCLNTLAQANDWCDQLGLQAAVVPDVYHCWWDPNFASELNRAGPQRIATFHLCDWLVPTRHLLLDRGMVGDGIIDHTAICRWLEEIGYTGPFELEIFSELEWWKRDPEEVLRIAVERCRPLVKKLTTA
ncbi:MAG: sugar phosphate isomerase/epimerase family protein [bacterium]